jgi:hypothetical protein
MSQLPGFPMSQSAQIKRADKLIVLTATILLVVPLAVAAAFFGILVWTECLRPNGNPLPPLFLSSCSAVVALAFCLRLSTLSRLARWK